MARLVTEEDVNIATELMKFALYSEKKQVPNQRDDM